MSRSLRAQLALRAATVMALCFGAISFVSVLALRIVLDREIDATILSVASIQAASLTDSPSGTMHFHDWELTPEEAASVQDLVRYAQVWQTDGTSLLRSQYMTDDLPLDTAALLRVGEGDIEWTSAEFQGVGVRVLYYPLERLGQAHQRHVLQVAAPTGARDDLVARVSWFVLVLSVVGTAATFSGSWWLAGRAIRPVQEIIEQAEAIEGTSPGARIRAHAETREYRRLVDVVNKMLERIQGAFEAQRRFAADASHELRSPLTAMRGELELALRRTREPDEYRRVLDSTLEEVVRLSRISEDLLLLARADSGAITARREPVELAGIVQRVLDRLRAKASSKEIGFSFRAEGDTTAEVDPVLAGQVVSNLAENAIKFTPAGGAVDVRVRGEADVVRLTVEDTGPGLPQEPVEQVFSRFYRGDAARPHSGEATGAGLGLAIVKAVADAHGGAVRALNRAGGGARFEVTFPKQAGAAR